MLFMSGMVRGVPVRWQRRQTIASAVQALPMKLASAVSHCVILVGRIRIFGFHYCLCSLLAQCAMSLVFGQALVQSLNSLNKLFLNC